MLDSPGAGAIGGCELPAVGTGNQTQVHLTTEPSSSPTRWTFLSRTMTGRIDLNIHCLISFCLLIFLSKCASLPSAFQL